MRRTSPSAREVIVNVSPITRGAAAEPLAPAVCAKAGAAAQKMSPARIAVRINSPLGQTERVSVGILEPCHPGAAWRQPDPLLVLGHARIPLEGDARGPELLDRPGQIRDAPAEGRVRSGVDLGHGRDPQVGSVRIENEGEAILADEWQAKRA